MTKISHQQIEQYKQIFGLEKICGLWNEFVSDAKQKLGNVAQSDIENQRLIYHSLRSSSLVFGMTEFSAFCQKTEEEILAGQQTGKKNLAEAQKLLEESIVEVEAYLA